MTNVIGIIPFVPGILEYALAGGAIWIHGYYKASKAKRLGR